MGLLGQLLELGQGHHAAALFHRLAGLEDAHDAIDTLIDPDRIAHALLQVPGGHPPYDDLLGSSLGSAVQPNPLHDLEVTNA